MTFFYLFAVVTIGGVIAMVARTVVHDKQRNNLFAEAFEQRFGGGHGRPRRSSHARSGVVRTSASGADTSGRVTASAGAVPAPGDRVRTGAGLGTVESVERGTHMTRVHLRMDDSRPGHVDIPHPDQSGEPGSPPAQQPAPVRQQMGPDSDEVPPPRRAPVRVEAPAAPSIPVVSLGGFQMPSTAASPSPAPSGDDLAGRS